MSLGERIEKKSKEVQAQKKEVLSQVNRHNILYGRIAKIIITIVGLVIIYLNWDFLVSHLATVLNKGVNLIQNPDEAAIVANSLLLTLIIATVGVEFIPFLGIGSTGRGSALTVSHTR